MSTEPTDKHVFEFRELFDDDYLHFYSERLTEETSDREAEIIWKSLELEEGNRILDLACGHGRIANRLAAKGAVVTALDATSRFLDIARSDAKALGVEVAYVEGDMRAIRWEQAFDAVVSWFTSFGYFDDDENREILQEVHRALVPGGSFLLETLHRDAIVGNFQRGEVTLPQRIGDDYMIDANTFDCTTGRLLSERTVIRDGKVRRFRYFVRLFSFTEIRDWLLTVGFKEIDGFAGDGSELTVGSTRLLVRARR